MAASDALSPAQKHQAYQRWRKTGQQTPGISFSNYFGGTSQQHGSYYDYDDDDEPGVRGEIVGQSTNYPQGPGIPDTESDSYGDYDSGE